MLFHLVVCNGIEPLGESISSLGNLKLDGVDNAIGVFGIQVTGLQCLHTPSGSTTEQTNAFASCA